MSRRSSIFDSPNTTCLREIHGGGLSPPSGRILIHWGCGERKPAIQSPDDVARRTLLIMQPQIWDGWQPVKCRPLKQTKSNIIMNTKITYTCINTYTASTSLQVSTYYDMCIESALKLLKSENPHNLSIRKIEVV